MLEKIKEIIAESLGTDISTLTEETSFKEDLGADSLDLFEMVMALEEAFNVDSLPLRQSWIFFVKPKGKYLPFAP